MTSAIISPVPMDIAIKDFVRKIFPKAYVYHQVTGEHLPNQLPYAICYQATDKYDRVELIDEGPGITFSYDFKKAEYKGNAEVLWVTCSNLDKAKTIADPTDTIVTVEPDDELQYYIDHEDVCGACRWLVKKYSQTSKW